MKRRTFLKSSVAAAAAAPLATGVAADEKEFIIDIHQHVNFHGRQNDVFVAHQRTMQISKTVLLPAGTAMERGTTHLGS